MEAPAAFARIDPFAQSSRRRFSDRAEGVSANHGGLPPHSA
jgi:hypothetical protein